jgi:ribulose 1,5-bisphosphate synthetase/thiazole synthase
MASTGENGQAGRIAETEFLIVGAGPAGASLACFLASHGTYLFPSSLVMKELKTDTKI